jgi:hypothetical protein
MSDLSPLEKQVEKLKKTYELDEECDEKWGPRRFVDAILDRDIRKGDGNIFKDLCVCNVKLDKLVVHKSKWKELYVLYIRAFQSMYSRDHLQKFLFCIDEERISNLKLSEIRPEWCNIEHEIYIFCWTKISSAKENKEKEQGKQLIRLLVNSFGVKDKAVDGLIKKISSHNETSTLIGRMARIMQDGNTSELLNKSIVYCQGLVTNGQIDMARLARVAMKKANASGVDMTKMNQISKLLQK